MSPTLVFVLIAIALLVLFAVLAVRRSRPLVDLNPTFAAIRALDIQAFRNLVDPEEEEYLRAHLPLKDFKRIKRERAIAALDYVKQLSGAALQFARFGDAAQRSPDPAIASSGRQIADSAVLLRLRTLDAGARLLLSASFPGLRLRPLRSLVEQYERADYLLVCHSAISRSQSSAA